MTREKEIEIALSKYIEERGDYGDYIAEAERDAAFIAGAKWADKHPINVWHNASEEPGKPYHIIIEINDDNDPTYEVISTDGTDEEFWKYLLSEMNITRWAYINDLLPKKIGD